MKRALNETRWFFDNYLNEYLKESIMYSIKEIDSKNDKYSIDMYWDGDESIGGIGGYNMPKNPIQNPFKSGIKRSIYRPLQYAAAEIDIRDIRYGARHVIQYAGMHLEAVVRYFLATNQIFGKIRQSNSTLGKAFNQLKSKGLIEAEYIVPFQQFIKLFNMAKHEINMDEERERLFSYVDALILYYLARILGVYLLNKMDEDEFNSNYEISIEM
ncbi:hypothetical protein MKZ20_21720 [Psychrobacillus sp. FSL K6-2684]|uniref:hypothetical protein n=1 Tax=unclassified Psychrobacillus TaxID=2636677 RepID=UPI0030F5B5CC